MTQEAAAVGNWWLAASSWPCSHLCIMSQAEFLVKSQIIQVTQPSYSPDLAPYNFWLFPKLKSPLTGMRFQTINEIQENTTGQLMTPGRTVWSPKVPILKETEASLSCVQCILDLVSSSVNVFIVHSAWLNTFWTDYVHMHTPTKDFEIINKNSPDNSDLLHFFIDVRTKHCSYPCLAFGSQLLSLSSQLPHSFPARTIIRDTGVCVCPLWEKRINEVTWECGGLSGGWVLESTPLFQKSSPGESSCPTLYVR